MNIVMTWTDTDPDYTPPVNLPCDPYFGSVKMLLHGDGTQGSTTITDSSVLRAGQSALTAVGAIISTAQSQYGGSSIYFDGVDDYVHCPQYLGNGSDIFNDRTDDFTLELAFRPEDVNGTTQTLFCRQASVGTTSMLIQLRISTTNKLELVVRSNGSSTVYTVTGTTTLVNNTWYSAAVNRTNNVFSLWLGTSLEGTLSQTIDFLTSGIRVGIGCLVLENSGPEPTAGTYFKGHIEELRWTQLIGRYPTAHAIPTEVFGEGVCVTNYNYNGGFLRPKTFNISNIAVVGNQLMQSFMPASGTSKDPGVFALNPGTGMVLEAFIKSLTPQIWFDFESKHNIGSPGVFDAATVWENRGSETSVTGLVYGGNARWGDALTPSGLKPLSITTDGTWPYGSDFTTGTSLACKYTPDANTSYESGALTVNMTILTASNFTGTAHQVLWHEGNTSVSNQQGLQFHYNNTTKNVGASWFNSGWREVTICTLAGGDILQNDTKYNVTLQYSATGGSGFGWVKFYLNGVLKGTGNLTPNGVQTTTGDAIIGTALLTNTNNEYTPMRIAVDNFLVWNSHVSDVNIAQLSSLSLDAAAMRWSWDTDQPNAYCAGVVSDPVTGFYYSAWANATWANATAVSLYRSRPGYKGIELIGSLYTETAHYNSDLRKIDAACTVMFMGRTIGAGNGDGWAWYDRVNKVFGNLTMNTQGGMSGHSGQGQGICNFDGKWFFSGNNSSNTDINVWRKATLNSNNTTDVEAWEGGDATLQAVRVGVNRTGSDCGSTNLVRTSGTSPTKRLYAFVDGCNKLAYKTTAAGTWGTVSLPNGEYLPEYEQVLNPSDNGKVYFCTVTGLSADFGTVRVRSVDETGTIALVGTLPVKTVMFPDLTVGYWGTPRTVAAQQHNGTVKGIVVSIAGATAYSGLSTVYDYYIAEFAV